MYLTSNRIWQISQLPVSSKQCRIRSSDNEIWENCSFLFYYRSEQTFELDFCSKELYINASKRRVRVNGIRNYSGHLTSKNELPNGTLILYTTIT